MDLTGRSGTFRSPGPGVSGPSLRAAELAWGDAAAVRQVCVEHFGEEQPEALGNH